MKKYDRPDIYFCPGCGYFFDEKTHRKVDVTLEELRNYPEMLRMVKKTRRLVKQMKRMNAWEGCH